MKHLPRRLILIGLIVLGFAAIAATGRGPANTRPKNPPPNQEQVNLLTAASMATRRGTNLANLPPPEQNPCQHCHIEGEIFWEWSPISRWLVFGGMNLIFIFGMARHFTVWRTRAIWQHRRMVQFGKIAAFFFILQASTGIILLLFNPTSPLFLVKLRVLIAALHWASALLLFMATLILSLAGYLFPWHQRPFWGLLFITTLIGGTLALAHLSFAYLYAGWYPPPAPGHLYTFHLLLSPLAIAGLMSIYFIGVYRRGETS